LRRAELARLRGEFKAALRGRMRWFFPGKEPEKAPGPSEPAPPSVVVGEEYAIWVRRRIKKSKRPVPVYGFHQEPVVEASDRAIRHMHRRRVALVAVVTVVVCLAVAGVLPAGWGALTLIGGVWG